MAQDLSIGVLSRQAGVKVPTIRYYESIGLLPEPARTASNRRVYGPDATNRLQFIRHARELGFELDAIRRLLALSDQPQHSCTEADTIAREHLHEIDSRIARLDALRIEVQYMIDECARGRIAQCRIMEVLSNHAYCRHTAH